MQSARTVLRSTPALARTMAPRFARPVSKLYSSQARQAAAFAAGRELQPRRMRNTSLTPFRSPWDLLDMVDPLFEGSMTHPMAELSRQMRNVPIDVLETAGEYTIKADLPGVAKAAIELEVDGDTISIAVRETSNTSSDAPSDTASNGDASASGGSAPSDGPKSADAKDEEGVTVHRMERSSSFVKRTVRLPEAADMEQVAAAFKDGVLSLRVPKKAHAVARRRAIDIASE